MNTPIACVLLRRSSSAGRSSDGPAGRALPAVASDFAPPALPVAPPALPAAPPVLLEVPAEADAVADGDVAFELLERDCCVEAFEPETEVLVPVLPLCTDPLPDRVDFGLSCAALALDCPVGELDCPAVPDWAPDASAVGEPERLPEAPVPFVP